MRQMMRLLTCMAALVLLVSGVRADVLADKVPADALIFMSWAGSNGLQGQYAQSRLKSIMDASTLQASVAKVLLQLEQNPQMPMEGKLGLEALKTVERMIPYPTALYVGPFADGAQPMPQVALLCQAGAESADLVAALKNFVPPGAPVVMVEKNGFVLIEVGDVAAKLDAAMGDATKSLAGVAAYKAAIGQVQKDGAMTVYVDAAALVAQADAAVTKFAPPNALPPGWTTARVRQMLNLDGFTQAAFTAGFEGKDWGSRSFVGLKGEAKGLTSLFMSKPLDMTLFKNAPETASWVAAGRMDLGALYDEVVQAVTSVNPNAAGQIAQVKNQIKTQFGVDFETDIIRALGDQWLIYTAPNVGGTNFMGLTLVSPMKDAARFSAAVDTLTPKLSQLLAAQSSGGDTPLHMSVEQYITGDVKLTYANVFLTPAIAVHDGKLYAGLSPQGLVSAVDATAEGKSILDNPKFVEFSKRLGVPDASSMTYMDLSVSGPDSYAMVSTLVGMLGTISDEAKPTMLPPLSKVYPQLTTAGGAAWNDAAGWHTKSIEPFPGAMMLAAGQQEMGMSGMTSVPLMVAILLPSLGRARELANRTAEAATISGCSKGCIIWANDNNDNMPESLAQLIAAGAISPKSLVTKRSNTQPMVLTEEQAKGMEKDWKILLPAADEHSDLIYLGKGTKNTIDSSMILMYVDPAKVDTKDGMNIGFGDAHVEWVRAASFKETFEANNKARETYHLKPLTLDERGLPVLDK